MVQRLLSVFLAVACIVLALALWQTRPTQAPISAARPDASTDFLLQPNKDVILDRRIDSLVIENTGLEGALGILARQTGINLRANWRVLTVAGIRRHAIVNCAVRDVTVRGALHAMLMDIAGNDDVEPAFYSADGIVTVTTRADAAAIAPREEVFLNIGPLVDAMTREEAPVVEVPADTPSKGQPQTQSSFFGVAPFSNSAVEEIQGFVTDFVDHDSWNNDRGSIRHLKSVLIIKQTPENILFIKELLRALYQAYSVPDIRFSTAPATRSTWIARQPDTLLSRPITAIDFDEAPFQTVVDQLARMAHVNLCVRWRSVLDAEITRTTPVTLHMKDVTLGKVISHLGDGIKDPSVNLYAESDGQIVTISPIARETISDVPFTTTFYNARAVIKDMLKDSEITGGDETVKRRNIVDRLIQFATDSAEPPPYHGNPWMVGAPRIYELGGVLAITSTSPSVVTKVVENLDQLRESMRRGDPLPPAHR